MTKLTPDEWASWVLMGNPDQRWPVPLNEIAVRIKQGIVNDRSMQQSTSHDEKYTHKQVLDIIAKLSCAKPKTLNADAAKLLRYLYNEMRVAQGE